MNNRLSVTETLALLDKLKGAVQDFAAREQKLENEFRTRSAAEAKAFENASKAQSEEQVTRAAQVEADAEAEKQKWLARFQKRKVRINEAHKVLRKRAMEDVVEHEGRRKHKLQSGAIDAERRRDRDLANATKELEEFRERLAESQQIFALLEKKAHGAFWGYRKFRRLLSPKRQWPEPDLSPDQNALFGELRESEVKTREGLQQFREMWLLRLVHFLPPVWLLLPVLVLLGAMEFTPMMQHIGNLPAGLLRNVIIGAVALLMLRAFFYTYALRRGDALARTIGAHLAKARRLHDACYQKADSHLQQEQQRIKAEFEEANRSVDRDYKRVVKEAIDMRDQRPREIDEKAYRVTQRHEQFQTAKLDDVAQRDVLAMRRLNEEAKKASAQLAETHRDKVKLIETGCNSQWQAMEAEWKSLVTPICERIQELNRAAEESFPEWQLPLWENWTPPNEFKNAARFGRLEVEVDKFAGVAPKDERLAMPCGASLSVPLLLAYPREGSILFESGKTGAEESIAAINNIIFRLLSAMPPGKVSFTVFDPVGLGQSFAGLMHLADYEQSHINSRIWTQTAQMEEKLAELSEHMEKVIQMYLRNEYETIAEYNAQAGSIAEKYHFLVIASFPANFSDVAARRLRNIATSGARCGVYTLVQWDQRRPMPQDFVPDELRKNGVNIVSGDKGFAFAGRGMAGLRLVLDAPPSAEFATHFLHQVGQSSKDSNRVEVPFADIAPQNSDMWTGDATEELRVPIGRSGATKLQYLAIGKGTRQHALIAGKTGSGKSTLFHVIITNLALWCRPEQVEFYLVDFKKGVEFKCYANRRLPHARVVAIESDRAFGLSVLERVDAELRRRGDLFRKLGVQDLPGYKRAGGTENIPRSLLLIDEFQEFFVEEDRVSQGAAVLLDRIVRQGRAFGIHVLLGSQTLGGAYTLARATLGQMVIRIALQCNEADAYLIMDQDNPAPRLLSRPGEGIYNDSAGSIEGNSPFQAVWLPEPVRDEFLEKVRERADHDPHQYPGPFVFEGNAPAEVRENRLLNDLLAAAASSPVQAGRIWLGAPNSIKGPTEAVFQRQSGNNLLVVGQNEEATLAMLGVSLVSLAAQFPVGSARFILLDSFAPGSPQAEFLDRVIAAIPHPIARPKAGGLAELMGNLDEELSQRAGSEDDAAKAPATYLIIHGLENFKKLRQEDEFSFSSAPAEAGVNPAAVFLNLIGEGPSHGFHVIATCDTYNNVSRFLGRKPLSEFSMRVLFQMSASDSAALIDAPDAGNLGMHRAIFFNDREGYLETFRPYARPDNAWIGDVAGQLKRLVEK